MAGASVLDPAAALAIQSVLSDDPGTYLEDELCQYPPWIFLSPRHDPVATPGGEHASND